MKKKDVLFNDIQKILLKWEKNNYRDFNWRKTKDPYAIFMSEMMLHRTKAEQVAKIYDFFLDKYSDVFILSSISETELFSDLKPLGLNWRIKNIKYSAEKIVQKYNGKIPSTKEELLALPGVGDYIAGAVLCIAFQKKTPLLDTNIIRFINRVFGYAISESSKQDSIYLQVVNDLMPQQNPRYFLYSILDFSSAQCRSIAPLCMNCPLASYCHYIKNLKNIQK